MGDHKKNDKMPQNLQRDLSGERQLQLSRLVELGLSQGRKRILYFPILYLIIPCIFILMFPLAGFHCHLDIPILILVFLLSGLLMVVTIYKNFELCRRIRDMRTERGEKS